MLVLFVCTGNICRSPIGEGLLRAAIASAGVAGVEVASAGTWADEGAPATPAAVAVMETRGLDISGHRARRLAAREAEAADLIVAMTSVHLREIETTAPYASPKVLLAKEVQEVRRTGPGLHGLLTGGRPPWRRALDLDDPMGLPGVAYERTAAQLEAVVEALVPVLGREHRPPLRSRP